jgi:hypothetical protein
VTLLLSGLTAHMLREYNPSWHWLVPVFNKT